MGGRQVRAAEAVVLNANDAFYRAFESLDPTRMEDVWLASPDVVCIHPGWRARIGIEAVMESWRAIFRGTHHMKFTVAQPVVAESGDAAMVTCIEMISQGNPAAPEFGSVQAVNAFRRVDGRWKMILHHASPFAPLG